MLTRSGGSTSCRWIDAGQAVLLETLHLLILHDLQTRTLRLPANRAPIYAFCPGDCLFLEFPAAGSRETATALCDRRVPLAAHCRASFSSTVSGPLALQAVVSRGVGAWACLLDHLCWSLRQPALRAACPLAIAGARLLS